ncbi:MAG: fasciclin domain-containing protein [Methanoculleus bourgensis]|uniref:Fasciclin domain-containing protein n=1 Tax=Methanoculleus bourgensis TaxID=83986 RepID=A0A8T7H5E8_9EURY|nr:fasciclin domain-containing protein [Methanoculleus bourgensis]
MRTTCTLLMVALVLGAAVLVCGCTSLREDNVQNQTPAGAPGENLTIDEVLVRDGNFSTFVRALDASRLEGLLTGPGPYTVFAPTDEAFSRLPPGTLDELFEDPKGNLAEILLYHVAPGEYPASEDATIATVQGSPIDLDATGESMTVNGAKVVRADIPAANGVIHAIDAVLLPPEITLPVINATATDTPTGTGNTTNTTG